MKVTFFVSLFLLTYIYNLQSQNFIKYKTHSLEAGYTHVTQKIDNIDEGMSGDKCFWDFSNLVCGDISSSDIISADESVNHTLMEFTNLAITKNNDHFFYSLNEEQLQFHGYVTEKAIIQFDQPIIRMKYPFKYKDKFEGTFSGTGLHNGVVNTTIDGNYSVDADGKGTLLLPNGTSINNAFRVKSIEHYFETSCKTIEWKITKYLWYTKEHRYPVFAVIEKYINNDDDNIIISKTGYYSEVAIKKEVKKTNNLLGRIDLNIYPNPSTEKINILYDIPNESKVSVSLYNTTGTKIADIVESELQKGKYKYEYYINENRVKPGIYYLHFLIGKKSLTQKVVINKP